MSEPDEKLQARGGDMETCGKCMGSGYGGHPDSGALCSDCNGSGGVRADLMAELVEALKTARDYVHDASRGALRYRGKADISNMAGEDLVMIDAALAKIKEPQT